MSDLEQSNMEFISDDEGSDDDVMDESRLPTFPSISNTNMSNKKDDIIKQVDGIYNEEELSEADEDADVADDEADDEDDDVIANAQNDEDDEDDDAADESVVNSDNEDDDISIDEETGVINKKTKQVVSKKTTSKYVEELPKAKLDIPVSFEKNESDYESDEDEEEDDDYLQKFDKEIRENYILEQHPESINHNYDEIYNLAKVQRNKDNIIVDSLHKTIPILTKYEKTRILGQRAKQLNNGAKPLVKLPVPLIDGYLIALKELEEKMIPVIIRRPLPNGASEYWHLRDLEIL
jgi:DNA-directed RNA polymerase I, II, and III subunit RPABC2